MNQSWLSVGAAAAELELSEQRVRSLLGSGALGGRKFGAVWFVDPVEVRRRSGRSKQSGRPLSAINAWRLLRLLASSGADRLPLWSGPLAGVGPVEKSRLRALVADLPDAEGLGRRVSSRADVRKMRVHSGVLERLLFDDEVSVGGGRAVAARGGGVAAGGLDRVYVQACHAAALVDRYRLRDDVEGNVEVAVFPDGIDAALLPEPGQPVALEVAWVDLLDDPDSRVRSATREWVAALRHERAGREGR